MATRTLGRPRPFLNLLAEQTSEQAGPSRVPTSGGCAGAPNVERPEGTGDGLGRLAIDVFGRLGRRPDGAGDGSGHFAVDFPDHLGRRPNSAIDQMEQVPDVRGDVLPDTSQNRGHAAGSGVPTG